jgi:hypothetical protein
MEDSIYLTNLNCTGHVMSSTLMNAGYSITFNATGHMPSGEKSVMKEN